MVLVMKIEMRARSFRGKSCNKNGDIPVTLNVIYFVL